MNFIEVENYEEMSEILLEYFVEQIRKKPDSVLSFTTGKTPESFLMRLADAVNDGLNIEKCIFMNLDEYVGRRDMPYSVYSFMHTCLYDRITEGPREIHMMNAEAENHDEELNRYKALLKKYPRDIQLLGLGTNGHIGANEPGTPFDSTLFVADSCESTIRATRELFHLTEKETPTRMFTMGFQEIMEAEHVILAASGKSKAQAVKAILEGEVTEAVPASMLKKHKNFTLLVDKEAASLLNKNSWNFIATWKMSYEGIQRAAKILGNGQSVHNAIVEAVKAVEDNESFCSVGYGGLPNRKGAVELDAAYMNGDTLRAGGVMAVQGIKNPVEIAWELSGHKRNCFLAGEGAMEYARSHRFAEQDMLSSAAQMKYEEAMANQGQLEEMEAYDGHDTVCVIGRDGAGTMGCGVSTSGLFLKHPGRVGDSPFIGSGYYADSKIGAAAATGVGEDILRGCLSYAIVNRLAEGCPVQQACEEVLNRHIRVLEQLDENVGSMSVIAMDKAGHIGAATNLEAFPFVVGRQQGECRIFTVRPEGDKMKVSEPEGDWWIEYQGD